MSHVKLDKLKHVVDDLTVLLLSQSGTKERVDQNREACLFYDQRFFNIWRRKNVDYDQRSIETMSDRGITGILEE